MSDTSGAGVNIHLGLTGAGEISAQIKEVAEEAIALGRRVQESILSGPADPRVGEAYGVMAKSRADDEGGVFNPADLESVEKVTASIARNIAAAEAAATGLQAKLAALSDPRYQSQIIDNAISSTQAKTEQLALFGGSPDYVAEEARLRAQLAQNDAAITRTLTGIPGGVASVGERELARQDLTAQKKRYTAASILEDPAGIEQRARGNIESQLVTTAVKSKQEELLAEYQARGLIDEEQVENFRQTGNFRNPVSPMGLRRGVRHNLGTITGDLYKGFRGQGDAPGASGVTGFRGAFTNLGTEDSPGIKGGIGEMGNLASAAFGGYAAFMGGMFVVNDIARMFSNSYKEAVQFEQAMVPIKDTLNDIGQSSSLKTVSDQLITVSESAGIAASKLVPIYQAALAQYGTTAAAQQITTQVAQYSQITGMDPAAAQKALRSIVAPFGLGPAGYQSIQDSLVGASTRYGINPADITGGMGQVAETGMAAGMDPRVMIYSMGLAAQNSGLSSSMIGGGLSQAITAFPTQAVQLLSLAQAIPQLGKVLTPEVIAQGAGPSFNAIADAHLGGDQLLQVSNSLGQGYRRTGLFAYLQAQTQLSEQGGPPNDTGAAQKRFNEEMGTTAKQFEALGNSLKTMGSELATGLLPILAVTATAINDLLIKPISDVLKPLADFKDGVAALIAVLAGARLLGLIGGKGAAATQGAEDVAAAGGGGAAVAKGGQLIAGARAAGAAGRLYGAGLKIASLAGDLTPEGAAILLNQITGGNSNPTPSSGATDAFGLSTDATDWGTSNASGPVGPADWFKQNFGFNVQNPSYSTAQAYESTLSGLTVTQLRQLSADAKTAGTVIDTGKGKPGMSPERARFLADFNTTDAQGKPTNVFNTELQNRATAAGVSVNQLQGDMTGAASPLDELGATYQELAAQYQAGVPGALDKYLAALNNFIANAQLLAHTGKDAQTRIAAAQQAGAGIAQFNSTKQMQGQIQGGEANLAALGEYNAQTGEITANGNAGVLNDKTMQALQAINTAHSALEAAKQMQGPQGKLAVIQATQQLNQAQASYMGLIYQEAADLQQSVDTLQAAQDIGNPLAQAQDAITAANDKINSVQAAFDSGQMDSATYHTQMNQAQADKLKAVYSQKQEQFTQTEAPLTLSQGEAQLHGYMVNAAQQSLQLAQDKLGFLQKVSPNDIAAIDAQKLVVDQQTLAVMQAQVAAQVANEQTQAALLRNHGQIYAADLQSLKAAKDTLAGLVQEKINPNDPAYQQAVQGVSNAEAQANQDYVTTTENHLQTLTSIHAMSLGQELSAYQQLLNSPQAKALGQPVQDQIRSQIQQIYNELAQNLQFDLPNSIDLKGLFYTGKRIAATGSSANYMPSGSGAYQDNRNITVTINTGATTQQVQQALSDTLSTANRTSGTGTRLY